MVKEDKTSPSGVKRKQFDHKNNSRMFQKTILVSFKAKTIFLSV